MSQETITLPDGYNGHTVECYAKPLEIGDDGLAKLRVVGSTYLIKFIRADELKAKIAKAKGE